MRSSAGTRRRAGSISNDRGTDIDAERLGPGQIVVKSEVIG
jgi:hypothetical protein